MIHCRNPSATGLHQRRAVHVLLYVDTSDGGGGAGNVDHVNCTNHLLFASLGTHYRLLYIVLNPSQAVAAGPTQYVDNLPTACALDRSVG